MKKTTLKNEKEIPGEQETTKPQTDVKNKGDRPEENLPEFPGREAKDFSVSPGGEPEQEPLTEVDVEEVCGDIIAVPFEIWGMVKKGVEPLSPKEQKLLGKPLSRLVVKYNVEQYMKDEFLFILLLGMVITKRVKAVKKDDNNDSGETGKR